MRVPNEEPKVAFQVLLPVSLLEATRKRCHKLHIDSVGGFIRQLLAAELVRASAPKDGSVVHCPWCDLPVEVHQPPAEVHRHVAAPRPARPEADKAVTRRSTGASTGRENSGGGLGCHFSPSEDGPVCLVHGPTCEALYPVRTRDTRASGPIR